MSSLPSIALAQINVTVGDIAGNCEKILAAWGAANAQGAQLVIFPELCVVGYPPEDLILTPDFRKRAMAAVRELAQKTSAGAALVIGSVWEEGDKIYNAALLLDGGNIAHMQPKTKLPNYGVFDEKRLFDAGDGANTFQWRGHTLGLLVCEDVWDISLSQSLKGAQAIIAINASPFEAGKLQQRYTVCAAAAKAAHAPVIYLNLVGGQDDIVFDGGSFAMDVSGNISARFAQFEEKTAMLSSANIASETPNELWSAMKLGLADYVHKNGFSGVLLGLSGGIDSAITAALAVDALGAKNVLGVLLPSPYTSQDSIDDALETGRLLGIETRTIPITPNMEIFSELLTPAMGKSDWMDEPTIGGNLQARLRGITLMALSNATGNMLLSTGNKSEIAVGYSTLYGDSCGAYNVLKDLYKTEVYKLAEWRNSMGQAIPKRSMTKAPTAELKHGQLDQDQLPPYDMLDAILALHIEGRLAAHEIIAQGFDKTIVEKVIKLVRINEYKRRQSCPGVKLSPMMFGRDRRFPLTNKA